MLKVVDLSCRNPQKNITVGPSQTSGHVDVSSSLQPYSHYSIDRVVRRPRGIYNGRRKGVVDYSTDCIQLGLNYPEKIQQS